MWQVPVSGVASVIQKGSARVVRLATLRVPGHEALVCHLGKAVSAMSLSVRRQLERRTCELFESVMLP